MGFLLITAALAATNESKVAQQEIFGPFATFIKFSSVEEAIAIANDCQNMRMKVVRLV